MSNPRDIIIRPMITEKSMKGYDHENKVTFEVAKGANKTHVKQAIEEIFNVKVEKVNMISVKAKKRRIGKYTGKTNAKCKAIVKLAQGSELRLFD